MQFKLASNSLPSCLSFKGLLLQAYTTLPPMEKLIEQVCLQQPSTSLHCLPLILKDFLKIYYIYLFGRMSCASVFVVVRGQLVGVNSLLPLCWSSEWHSVYQV